jgi:hypothetical protein
MARLIARDRDGCGGVAHTSLAQAALVPMTMHWSRADKPSPAFAKGLDKSRRFRSTSVRMAAGFMSTIARRGTVDGAGWRPGRNG